MEDGEVYSAHKTRGGTCVELGPERNTKRRHMSHRTRAALTQRRQEFLGPVPAFIFFRPLFSLRPLGLALSPQGTVHRSHCPWEKKEKRCAGNSILEPTSSAITIINSQDPIKMFLGCPSPGAGLQRKTQDLAAGRQNW